MTKTHLTYLDTLTILPEQLTSSADLRYTLTGSLKTLLQQTNYVLKIGFFSGCWSCLMA